MKRILAVGLALMVFFFWLFDVLSQDRIELKASDKQRTIAGASLQEEYVSRQRLKAAMMSEEEIRETLQVLAQRGIPAFQELVQPLRKIAGIER